MAVRLFRRLKKAVDRPALVKRHASKSFSAWLQLLRTRRPFPLIAVAIEGITGYNPYIAYLRRRESTPYRAISIPDFDTRMSVDIGDEGLGRNLLIYQTHERALLETYLDELQRMEGPGDTLTILEAGANAGYYLFAAANAVDCDVIAFEPEPSNHALLQRNVERNGLRDRVTIEQAALGASETEVELLVGEQSNRHRVIAKENPARTNGATLSVRCLSIDEYLRQNGMSPSSIDAVRMDVEGAEVDIVDGMSDLLRNGGRLLLYVESHPNLIERSDLTEMYRKLDEHGFELELVMNEGITSIPWPGPLDVDSFEELSDIDYAFGFIAKRDDREKPRRGDGDRTDA